MTDSFAKRIRIEIESTKNRRYEDRSDSYELGMKLLFQTAKNLERLASVVGENSELYIAVSNELAIEVLQCGIDYFLTIKDKRSFSESTALEMLHSANALTTKTETLDRISDNIEGIRDWVKTQEYRYDQNRGYNFDKVLLHTAFSFMTCDGKIDQSELNFIKSMANDKAIFGNINIDSELNSLVMGINAMGLEFLKDYFRALENANFNQDQEIKLLDIALNTVYADQKIDYYELKFFKIFRTMLSISDAEIKHHWPDLSDEFLERDIFSHAYLSQLFDDYFEKIELPEFSI